MQMLYVVLFIRTIKIHIVCMGSSYFCNERDSSGIKYIFGKQKSVAQL